MKKWAICWHAAVLSFSFLASMEVRVSAQHDPQKNPGQSRTPKTERELSIERISREPDSNQSAESLRWSADGARVAWMQLAFPPPKSPFTTPQQEIWTPATSGAGRLLLLLSATQVTNALRGTDAPLKPKLEGDDEAEANPFLLQDFAWSPDHASLLLIGSTSLVWFDLATAKYRAIVSGDATLSDVSQSPDGRTIAFIQNHGLWLVDAKGGKPRLLAGPAHPGILEGEPDWLYRNELHLARGYTWSPDSSRIAYFETDDRAVAKYAFHSSEGEDREIVFPKPGGKLPVLRVLIKPVMAKPATARPATTSPAVEMNLGPTLDAYLPRIAWLPDSRRLAIERLNRRQQSLDLFLANAETGKTRLLLNESDRYWINLSNDLYFLKDGKRFLWSSERTGFRHLYLYDLEGKELAQLTHGDWEVTRLDAVDEATQRVYFTATEKTPLERHLYAIHLDGSSMVRITQQAGTHVVRFAPGGKIYADCFSNTTTPTQVSVAETSRDTMDPQEAQSAVPTSDAKSDAPLSSAKSSEPPLQPIEFIQFNFHLGAEAHAFLIKPPAFDPTRKYPVIVYLAGGPGEQLVRDAWGGPEGLWMQLMTREGYLVFALDNHGTAGRGHYFEEPIHLRLGAQELVDQRDGLNYLRTLPYVDSTRFGVCGWGYGGFLVIHAMLDRPVAFKAGFAGAPIVDWHFYDPFFAERYLDDPVVHADGWDASVALENRAPNFFNGTLMVAQGTDDEFVHMENVLTLQDHLLDAGKSAGLLLFPDRGHRIDDLPARQLLFSRMTEFFLKNL